MFSTEMNTEGTFIVQFLCQKMKFFLFALIILEKNASSKDLKVGNIVFFSLVRQPLDDPWTFA